jgi:hypothetical protein
MHTNFRAKAYTPQLSRPLSGILRRIAWLNKEPMTKTLERIVREAAVKYRLADLCQACEGHEKQCKTCLALENETEAILNNLSAVS